MSAALKPRFDEPESTVPLGTAAADEIDIPTWVPPEFRSSYRKVAAERGEEEAAAWARRMKNGEPRIDLKPREKRLLDLRKAGHSLSVTARKADVTPSAVKKTFQRLRERGVVIPEPVAAPWEWTDELEDRVRKFYAQGWSAAAIAEQIDAPSRNTVIGKIARLGLKRALGPIKPKVALLALKRDTEPVTCKSAIVRKPVVRKPTVARSLDAQASTPEPVEALPATTEANAAPPGAITIHELRDHRCHWPFGDSRDEGFRYCGAPVAAATRERGRFYCDGHMAAAAVPGKGRGR